jgi:RNA polymerase sigma-70 factor (ECF subfamily)
VEKGDFQELVRRHRDRIYTFAFYSLKNREDAEDVTQEVLIRLWKHWQRLEGDHLQAWIVRVTKNACVDAVRRRQTRRRLESTGEGDEVERAPDDAADPARDAAGADFRRRLESALAALAEPYRSIVILREIQGLAYDEIAAAVDKPLNTVKVYLHRGRRMLRDELREEPAYAQTS